VMRLMYKDTGLNLMGNTMKSFDLNERLLRLVISYVRTVLEGNAFG
jgi:hypothetical protein